MAVHTPAQCLDTYENIFLPEQLLADAHQEPNKTTLQWGARL